MTEIYQQLFAASDVRRLLAVAYGVTRIDRYETVQAWLDMDIMLPFSVLIARPYWTMDTHDIVMIKSGMDTGMTLFGNDYTEQGHDANASVWIISHFFYAQAYIYTPASVGKLKDAIISGVHCGMGRKSILSDADTPFSGSVDKVKDIMYFLGGPYDMRLSPSGDVHSTVETLSNPVSITGTWDALPVEPNSISEYTRMLGVTPYYRKIFPGTFQESTNAGISTTRMTMSSTRFNVLCWLGEHYFLDPATGQFTGHVHNTGHFGKTATMPGCARARKFGVAGRYPPVWEPQVGLVPSQ
jgi:hypothetical protein